MYQEEDEKELAEHGFHISDDDADDLDEPLDDIPEDGLDFGGDDDDPDNRFH